MNEQQVVTQKQGAVIGGWVCVALGTVLMIWTLFSFVLYLPLFLAAFVLGIVATAQRRLGHGIPILLLSVVIPLVLGISLGAYRTQQVMDDAKKSNGPNVVSTDASSGDEGEPALNPNAEALYITENLDLYDFQAKYMNSALDGRVPGVTFKIKNKGDRTLERIKVVVLFKDKSGSVIAEDSYTPVLVSPYSVSSSNKPLKAGYIWQQEQGRFYTAKSVPTEWEEGSAEANITEIRFQKEE